MVTVGSILRETFRFMARNGRAIAVWSAIYVALNLVLQLALPQPLPQADLSAVQFWAQFPQILLPRFVIAFVVLVTLYAACFRAVMLPGEHLNFYLRFGGDELRLTGLIVGTFMALGTLIFLATLLVFFLGGALIAVAGWLGVIVAVVAMLGLWGGLIYAMVRLSPAWPLTIMRGRFALDEGWRISKGRFWQIFGAYLVVFLIIAAVGLVVMRAVLGPVFYDLFQPRDPAAHARIVAFQMAQVHASVAVRVVRSLVAGIVGGIVLVLHVAVVGWTARLLIEERAPVAAGSHGGPWGQIERSKE